ncbi:MAG: WecB/TagA/CpsF family glycosyltransferase [Candidatus Pacebacteria bacterium]|nr:WecB/TagA/CpsF family glycosyltransferase [Candidatus Paceibacterota bacterium]
MRFERVKILETVTDKTTSKEALENIKIFLSSSESHHIVTLNSEMVVRAQTDRDFSKIINDADLVIADGMGILIASSFLKKKKGQFLPDLSNLVLTIFNAIFFPKKNKGVLPERISGIDLIYKICGSDFAIDRTIYLVGAEEGIAERTGKVLKKNFPKIRIVGAEEGIRKNSTKKENEDLIERINTKKPEIIFVAFGAPKQEKWIYENLKKMPSIKVAMGVGGSFDFISGKTKRAPQFVQQRGWEWLWRLLQEPKRIKRIHTATWKLTWLIFWDKKGRMGK